MNITWLEYMTQIGWEKHVTYSTRVKQTKVFHKEKLQTKLSNGQKRAHSIASAQVVQPTRYYAILQFTVRLSWYLKLVGPRFFLCTYSPLENRKYLMATHNDEKLYSGSEHQSHSVP